MYVVKRNGNKQPVSFDKITARIKALTYGLDQDFVEPVAIAQKVVAGVYAGVTTSELDELAAETSAYMSTQHPDFSILAARLAVSNLHKNTKKSFVETVKDLYNIEVRGERSPLISDETYQVIMDHADELEAAIVMSRDYTYDYFGFKTSHRGYLLRINGKIVERPQHMLMRVSVGIWGRDIPKVIEMYNLLSNKWYTHATPTLFNAGTPRPQMSSCFLLTMKSDSIFGFYDTLKQCAIISKHVRCILSS